MSWLRHLFGPLVKIELIWSRRGNLYEVRWFYSEGMLKKTILSPFLSFQLAGQSMFVCYTTKHDDDRSGRLLLRTISREN